MLFPKFLKNLWIWIAWVTAIKLRQGFWCSGKTFLPARIISFHFSWQYVVPLALLLHFRQYFNVFNVLWFWLAVASRIDVLKYFPLMQVDPESCLKAMSLCSYKIWLFPSQTGHWVLALGHCTTKSSGTASLFLEVSGSECFGFKLAVSKHQPSWSMFLMLFPGRQWDLCSFRIVFQRNASSPSFSWYLKKIDVYPKPMRNYFSDEGETGFWIRLVIFWDQDTL